MLSWLFVAGLAAGVAAAPQQGHAAAGALTNEDTP